MIRAVLDTNVLLSGVLGYDRPESTPGEIMRRWRHGAFGLMMSQPLMDELEHTLARTYFVEKLTQEQRKRALITFRAYAQQVEITVQVRGVAPDPNDDHVLAAALSSQAEYLVTGDQPLLGLGAYESVAVISPRAFLDILQSAEGSDSEDE